MKSYIFNIIIALLFLSIPISKGNATTNTPDSVNSSKYEKRIEKYYSKWNALIPKQIVLQYAGNMGMFSGGIGWDYGKRKQWETHFLLGFLCQHDSHRPKMTITLKQNFIPWHKDIGKGWILDPLECGIYINSILGGEFWGNQPSRYPNKYYQFSTKIRTNIFLGQRITKKIPGDKRKFVKGFTFFYEVSSPDIYLLEWCRNSYLKFSDVFSLSLGIKLQIM